MSATEPKPKRCKGDHCFKCLLRIPGGEYGIRVKGGRWYHLRCWREMFA